MVVNPSELVTVTKSVRYEAVRPDGRLRPSPCRWPAVRVPPVVLQACTWGAAAVVSSSSPSARREAAPLPASSSWRNGGLPPSSGRDRTRGLLPRPGNQPSNLNHNKLNILTKIQPISSLFKFRANCMLTWLWRCLTCGQWKLRTDLLYINYNLYNCHLILNSLNIKGILVFKNCLKMLVKLLLKRDFSGQFSEWYPYNKS